MNTIKVHIVDDSATVRSVVAELLEQDKSIEISGLSSNPIFAEKRMNREWPDVIVLDLEMPQMDGLTFLKKIMGSRPTPIIICSSYAEQGAKVAMDALQAGAVDVITKPKLGVQNYLKDNATQFIDAVKAAAMANPLRVKQSVKASNITVTKKHNADIILDAAFGKVTKETKRVVAIGSSTGGTNAIENIVTKLPVDAPAMVIVQHMPANFTQAFAQRLDSICGLQVKEAEDGEELMSGKVLIAPGDRHLLIQRRGDCYVAKLKDGPLVCRHKPSVDVLFRSVAGAAGKNALGIILTGMGSDGAMGMLEMRTSGSETIAQDEESCVVYGMPKVAVQKGGVNRVMSLNSIPGMIGSL